MLKEVEFNDEREEPFWKQPVFGISIVFILCVLSVLGFAIGWFPIDKNEELHRRNTRNTNGKKDENLWIKIVFFVVVLMVVLVLIVGFLVYLFVKMRKRKTQLEEKNSEASVEAKPLLCTSGEKHEVEDQLKTPLAEGFLERKEVEDPAVCAPPPPQPLAPPPTTLLLKKTWKYSSDGVLRGSNLQKFLDSMHQKDCDSVEGKLGKLRWRLKKVTRHPPVIDEMVEPRAEGGGDPRATSAAEEHKRGTEAPRLKLYESQRAQEPEPEARSNVEHPERADKVWVPYSTPKCDYDRYDSDDLRSINTDTLSTQSDDSDWLYDDSTQMSLFSDMDPLPDLDELVALDEVNRGRIEPKVLKKRKKMKRKSRRFIKKKASKPPIVKKRLKEKKKEFKKKEHRYSTSDEENLLIKIRRSNRKIYHRRMAPGPYLKREDHNVKYDSAHSSDVSLCKKRRVHLDNREAKWNKVIGRQFKERVKMMEEEKRDDEEKRVEAIKTREQWEKKFEPYMGEILAKRKLMLKKDTMHKAKQELYERRYEQEKKSRTPEQMVMAYMKTSFEPDPEEECRIVKAAYRSVQPIDNYILARKQDRWEHLYRAESAEFSHDWARVRMTKDYRHECDFYDAAWMFPSARIFEKTYSNYANKLIAASSPMFQESVPILWHWLWENNVQFLVMLNQYEECNLYKTLHWFPTKPGDKYKFGRNQSREYHITCVSMDRVMENKGTERKFIFEFIHGGQKMAPRTFTILRMKTWRKHQIPLVWEPYADLCERIRSLSIDRPVVVMSVLGSGRACTLIMALQAAIMVQYDDDVSIHNMVASARESKRIACTDEGQSYVWRMIHYELIFRWWPKVAAKYNKKYDHRNAVYFKYAMEFNAEQMSNLRGWMYREMVAVQKSRVLHYEYFVGYHMWWNIERYLLRHMDNKRALYTTTAISKGPGTEEMGYTRYAPTVRRKLRRNGDKPRQRATTNHLLDDTQDEWDPRDDAIDGQKMGSNSNINVIKSKIKVPKKNPYWKMHPLGTSATYWKSKATELQWFTLYFQRQFPRGPFKGASLVNGGMMWIRRKHRNPNWCPRVGVVPHSPKYGVLCRRMAEQREAVMVWKKKVVALDN